MSIPETGSTRFIRGTPKSSIPEFTVLLGNESAVCKSGKPYLLDSSGSHLVFLFYFSMLCGLQESSQLRKLVGGSQ